MKLTVIGLLAFALLFSAATLAYGFYVNYETSNLVDEYTVLRDTKPRSPRVPQNLEYCVVYKVDKDHPTTENHVGGLYGNSQYSMSCSTAPDLNTI